MRGAIFVGGIEFVVESCFKCGCLFAMQKMQQDTLVRTHADFFCPNGHSQAYISKTSAEIARDQAREAANATQAKLNEANHSLLVTQKKLAEAEKERKRIEARVHRGACPCCNRTFQNLASHMKSKHPSQIEGKARGSLTGAI